MSTGAAPALRRVVVFLGMIICRTVHCKRFASLWLALILSYPAHATSIILLITQHDIVIGADGKVVLIDPKRGLQGHGTLQKVAGIQNRIVVAQSGEEMMPGDVGYEYSFDVLVRALRRNIKSDTTIEEVVYLVKLALSRPLPHFQDLLTKGLINPQLTAGPRQENLLMTVTVAGFENHHPVVYIVQRGVDWKQLLVKEPSSRRVYPDDSTGRKVTLQGTTNKGVSDLQKGAATAANREEVQRLPLEYRAMTKDEDLSREQLILLNRSLLDLDVKGSPEDVGYPLTVVAVNPKGITTRQYKQFNDR